MAEDLKREAASFEPGETDAWQEEPERTENPGEAAPEAEVPEDAGGENETESRLAELEDSLARTRADFYNYRQRMTKERQGIRKLTVEDTVTALLPVLDNLDRALAVPEDGSARDVLIGVDMVKRQFLSILEDFGVRVIPAKGETFDPAVHEAVATVPVENPEEDGVVQEEQLRGYRSEDRVLRASRVTVGKAE